MKIGILGSSDVAKDLAAAFLKEGHKVMLGSRQPAKLDDWVNATGDGASRGTFSDTAKFGELIVVAVHGTKSLEAIQLAGVENFKGKVVIDATNPLDMSAGVPKLIGGLGTSGGELIQSAVPEALVVKAFNSVGHAHFYKPQFAGGPPDMFICGDDAKAKDLVSRVCRDFGWNPIDVGGIGLSHYLEAAATIWIITAFTGGHWNQAFKLLRKGERAQAGESRIASSPSTNRQDG